MIRLSQSPRFYIYVRRFCRINSLKRRQLYEESLRLSENFHFFDAVKSLAQLFCSDCTGDEMAERTRQVIAIAEEKYNAKPSFHVHQVVVSGILQWHYQVQVFVGAVR